MSLNDWDGAALTFVAGERPWSEDTDGPQRQTSPELSNHLSRLMSRAYEQGEELDQALDQTFWSKLIEEEKQLTTVWQVDCLPADEIYQDDSSGVELEMVQNSLWVRFPGTDGGELRIDEGEMNIQGLEVTALRGPEDGLFCIARRHHQSDDEAEYVDGFIACGIHNAGTYSRRPGPKAATLAWFQQQLLSSGDPVLANIELGVARSFNQGRQLSA